jgi:hypothetical protein
MSLFSSIRNKIARTRINAPSLEAVYPVPDDDPLEDRIMEEEFPDSSVQGTYLLLYECILQA